MRVRVYHRDDGELRYVANVSFAGDSVDDALDHAWERTQNIRGSWSMGPWLSEGHERNLDFSDDVKRLVTLPIYQGRAHGLRSSMVGDLFEVEGKVFKVASFGFEASEEVPE